MQEVHQRVFVASAWSCIKGSNDTAVVHACKTPCHQKAVGYTGSLPTDHPNYLVLEGETDLYLNIIDPPIPLFKPVLFNRFLFFATHHWRKGKELIIHCNQGESRAPSLALLLLAHLSVIDNSSYGAARQDFQKLYPRYQPGKGIATYFKQNWSSLVMD